MNDWVREVLSNGDWRILYVDSDEHIDFWDREPIRAAVTRTFKQALRWLKDVEVAQEEKKGVILIPIFRPRYRDARIRNIKTGAILLKDML